jgi:threonine/homoserine/homoserine lactone efflux protein
METLITVVTIISVLILGAISPGPSFILVARTALCISRQDGIAAALGMGVGGVIFSLLALFGLQVVLETVPTLYLVLKIAGGLYLLYLAIQILRSASTPLQFEPVATDSKQQRQKSFMAGLLTQLCNPKAAVIYGSIFAALLPSNFSNSLYFVLPPAIFLMETGWYSFVSIVLSSSKPRAIYLQWKAGFDRVAGSVMAVLGIKLIAGVNQ